MVRLIDKVKNILDIKLAIKESIENKGVTVDSEVFDEYPHYIDSIVQKSEYNRDLLADVYFKNFPNSFGYLKEQYNIIADMANDDVINQLYVSANNNILSSMQLPIDLDVNKVTIYFNDSNSSSFNSLDKLNSYYFLDERIGTESLLIKNGSKLLSKYNTGLNSAIDLYSKTVYLGLPVVSNYLKNVNATDITTLNSTRIEDFLNFNILASERDLSSYKYFTYLVITSGTTSWGHFIFSENPFTLEKGIANPNEYYLFSSAGGSFVNLSTNAFNIGIAEFLPDTYQFRYGIFYHSTSTSWSENYKIEPNLIKCSYDLKDKDTDEIIHKADIDYSLIFNKTSPTK